MATEAELSELLTRANAKIEKVSSEITGLKEKLANASISQETMDKATKVETGLDGLDQLVEDTVETVTEPTTEASA